MWLFYARVVPLESIWCVWLPGLVQLACVAWFGLVWQRRDLWLQYPSICFKTLGVACSMVTERALELPSRIRSLLGERLGSRRADMWFDSASTVSVEGGKLAVDAESSYAADWIRKNFGGDLRAVSQEALGRDDFELRVKETPSTHIIDAPPRSTATSDPCDNPPLRAPLRTHHRTTEAWRRLEDFVVGPSNKMAFESALNFATTHSIGNCLVIHGSCGVGKTHLLQGLCRRRRESRTQQRVRYVTAEQFTNEYIQSVRNGTIDAFRARVRRVDVLAIDDVHFLAGKTATQNEFLHTLDAVQLAGSQVVLATDEHPHLVRRLSQSLVSRMLAGMVVRVEAPDLSLRNALVKSIALGRSVALSQEAVQAIALRCVGGAREIEGAISSLQALQSTQEQPSEISCAMVDSLLRHEKATTGGIPVRICAIMDLVCLTTGVEVEQLAGQNRHRRVALARALVAWLARQHTSMSFPEIARALGRTSHSSVHASSVKIDSLIKSNESVDAGAAGTCLVVELTSRLSHALRNSPNMNSRNSANNSASNYSGNSQRGGQRNAVRANRR